MTFAKILGTGSYLPNNVIKNDDLPSHLNTSNEWIIQRTGIEQRYIAKHHENVVTMGANAAHKAIDAAGLSVTDIDMIIVASCTQDKVFPSAACRVQAELNIPACPAFDIQAACSGFIYGLNTANAMILNGSATNVLIIGSEVMSRVLDWDDRTTCVLFGDGAGAVVLGKSNEPGILSTHLASDGNYGDLLFLNNSKVSEDDVLHMEGKAVFKWAVKWLAEVAQDAIVSSGINAEDVDWVIPHQANLRIINSTVKSLGIPKEKVVVTVNKHANTSAASVPLALDEAIRDGRIQRGQNLLLEAFGGGLTWASALIKY